IARADVAASAVGIGMTAVAGAAAATAVAAAPAIATTGWATAIRRRFDDARTEEERGQRETHGHNASSLGVDRARIDPRQLAIGVCRTEVPEVGAEVVRDNRYFDAIRPRLVERHRKMPGSRADLDSSRRRGAPDCGLDLGSWQARIEIAYRRHLDGQHRADRDGRAELADRS